MIIYNLTKPDIMCIICESDFDHLNTLKEIDCNSCQNLTHIPQLENLEALDCRGCLNITTIPDLHNLKILYCNWCLFYEIPNLNNLEILSCGGCQNITEIPRLNNLKILSCGDCLNIRKISSMNSLKILWCSGCVNITSVSHLINVNELLCVTCPWLKESRDYKPDNVAKVMTIQLWWKRVMIGKKLLSLVYSPWFLELYYKPGGRGHYISMLQATTLLK